MFEYFNESEGVLPVVFDTKTSFFSIDRGSGFNAVGWGFVGMEFSIEDGDLAACERIIKEKRKINKLHGEEVLYGQYTTVSHTFILRREWSFYFTRVVVVLSIISFLTVAAFLFDIADSSIADRFGYVSTLLLTAVAYMLITVSYIPPLNYLTLLDKYVYFTFLFITLISIEIGFETFMDDEIETLDVYFVIDDLIFWLIVHFVFGYVGYVAYHKESNKINKVKQQVDDEEERKHLDWYTASYDTLPEKDKDPQDRKDEDGDGKTDNKDKTDDDEINEKDYYQTSLVKYKEREFFKLLCTNKE